MTTLKICQDSIPIRSRCSAVDCFDSDIGIAQGSDLIILFSSEMVSPTRILDDVP
jgi:hypothetical protein